MKRALPPPRRVPALIVALQFLTRLPLPRDLATGPHDLIRAAPYFPAVGALVGGLCAATAAALLTLTSLAPGVVAVMAVALGVLVTGAFHEDGLADAADGIAGGLERGDRLRIMRDSRVGTFGALALVLLILGRVASLWAMDVAAWTAALLAAHTLGRYMALVLIRTQPYARDDDPGVGKPMVEGLSRVGFVGATVTTAALLWLIGGRAALVAAAAAGFVALGCAWYVRRRLGGITGDCLGAANVCCELAALLCFAAAHPALTSPWVAS
jgi:adenosylcobinamide-GDP ribazoletransferase